MGTKRFRIEEELCKVGDLTHWDTFKTVFVGKPIEVFDRFYCDCGNQHDFREKTRGPSKFFGYTAQEIEGHKFICEQCKSEYLVKDGTTYIFTTVEAYIVPVGAVLVD